MNRLAVIVLLLGCDAGVHPSLDNGPQPADQCGGTSCYSRVRAPKPIAVRPGVIGRPGQIPSIPPPGGGGGPAAGDGLQILHFAVQQQKSDPAWGTALSDIASHL